jgi:hypothetical protein
MPVAILPVLVPVPSSSASLSEHSAAAEGGWMGGAAETWHPAKAEFEQESLTVSLSKRDPEHALVGILTSRCHGQLLSLLVPGQDAHRLLLQQTTPSGKPTVAPGRGYL